MPETERCCLDPRFSTTRQLFAAEQFQEQEARRYADCGGLRRRGYGKRSRPEAPVVSIITAVYNAEQYLADTILSVLGQSYDNVEFIIVDGGSSDGTVEIIRQYEEYIDLWISEPDRGVYDAMNKGIALSSGEWLNFMNAGDKLLHLDVPSLQKTSSCFCYDERFKKIDRRPFTKRLLCRNTPYHQSMFYKRSDIVPYDLSHPVIADFEQMARILGKIGDGGVNNSLVYYNLPGISNTAEESLGAHASRLGTRLGIIRANFGARFYYLALAHTLRIFLTRCLRRGKGQPGVNEGK